MKRFYQQLRRKSDSAKNLANTTSFKSQFLKKSIRDRKALFFVGTRIENHRFAGAKTSDFSDVMYARPIDVEPNGPLTNRTLGEERVESLACYQLEELYSPYPEVPHVGHPKLAAPANPYILSKL
jgi:hypothetical protein